MLCINVTMSILLFLEALIKVSKHRPCKAKHLHKYRQIFCPGHKQCLGPTWLKTTAPDFQDCACMLGSRGLGSKEYRHPKQKTEQELLK